MDKQFWDEMQACGSEFDDCAEEYHGKVQHKTIVEIKVKAIGLAVIQASAAPGNMWASQRGHCPGYD